MKRVLSGSLSHLSPTALMRLLSATRSSGRLDLVTDVGELSLEVRDGRVDPASADGLTRQTSILACASGAYRFEPSDEADPATDEWLGLADVIQTVSSSKTARHSLSSDVDIDSLLAGEVGAVVSGAIPPTIHVLPDQVPDNPLEDLLEELEAVAPEEILLREIGVVATDPRLWRGALQREWRRRGWRVRLLDGVTSEQWPQGMDCVVVHHQLSITRVGHEDDWIGMIARLRRDRVPVVWVGPLGDPAWVQKLVEAGVAFMLPPPSGDTGDVARRFRHTLTTVVNRYVASAEAETQLGESSSPVSELVEALVHQAAPEESAAFLLQLTAAHLARGALLTLEETAIRCRAAFGYPVPAGGGALPRGIGFLERTARSQLLTTEIDPAAAGALQLARALGVDELPPDTAVIPVGTRTAVTGLLVGDRLGRPLGDLDELVQIASRVGGAFM